jgi:branched-chain amino acid transport system permease protein
MSRAANRASLAFRDAFLSALVALGIFGVIVGLQTRPGPDGLFLNPRPIPVAVLVALVFVGRLAWLLIWGNRPAAPARAARISHQPGIGRTLAILFLVFAVIMPLLAFVPPIDLGFMTITIGSVFNRAMIDLGILIMTYVMLGWGLNIVVGLAGLLDLGYVAFYAVGAYSYALFATSPALEFLHLGFWSCLPIAGLLAALFGVLLGFPVLRLRGDYLAIVTLAFGEIVRVVINNWVSLTNGPNGILDIPRPTFFGLEVVNDDGPGTFAGFFHIEPSLTHRYAYLYYVILGLALLTNWVSLRLRRQPLGRAWEALREDEIACRSLGINVRNTKLTAFATGAFFGGFAGAFFATRAGFISPESFTFIESAIVLAIVVLGGLGSQMGTVLAALVMIGGTEELRVLLSWLAERMDNPALEDAARDLPIYRMLIFGLALVVMMIFRPRGLITSRAPTVVLNKREMIDASLIAEGQG